ncbi:MAG: radical SAM protein [Candidatus Omnitrophica bacterium]|nr:radical SAM protein [Candidatus Omnitrophota bacterium]
MKVKLVLTPYYFYHAFMPPLGLALVSSALSQNNIEHDIDDLYVKLYRSLVKGSIKTDVFLDQARVNDYLRGSACAEIDAETAKVMALTDFSGYDYVCFSGHYPSLDRINSQAIAACLMKKIKDSYGVIIVANFELPAYREAGLIDYQTSSIDSFIDFLNVKNKLNPKLPRIFLEPNFKGFPLSLYKYSRNTIISEFLPHSGRISNLSRYTGVSKSLPLLLPYTFIEGCQNSCIFCELSGKPGFKIKDYDRIIRELKFLKREHKTQDFFFLNSNINPTKQTVRDLTDKIAKERLKIKFTDCATFNNLDKEILLRLKEAGAVRLVIGLESAGIKLQKYIGKVIDLKHASHILKLCHDLGIWVEIDLLIGLPFETSQDIISTLEFIRDNNAYIKGVNLNRFVLKPESLMFRSCAKYRIINVREQSNPGFEFAYDEFRGWKWDMARKLMEYRYSRFLECLDRNKIDYFRPVQFVFLMNRKFKDPRRMNKYLARYFFTDRAWEKNMENFINELKQGEDIARVKAHLF